MTFYLVFDINLKGPLQYVHPNLQNKIDKCNVEKY